MSATTLPSGQIVYDPTGVIDVAAQPLAPRLESLGGIRLGVLDNSKWNAGALLRRTVALLDETEGPFTETRFYKKHSFSSNADPDLIGHIAAEVDAVVTAIGD